IYAMILNDLDSLYRELINHNIKEVIVNDKIDREVLYNLKTVYNILVTVTNLEKEYPEYKDLYKDVTDSRLLTSIKHLLTYVTETKKSSLKYLKKVNINKEEDHLLYDFHTKKNLEITETIRDNTRNNSLLWFMDKTKTAMGSRLLK